MPEKYVLKWEVPVDDQDHLIGAGRVLHVDAQAGPTVIQVWTEETTVPPEDRRLARAYGTGQPVPADSEPLGTAVTHFGLVWHLYSPSSAATPPTPEGATTHG